MSNPLDDSRFSHIPNDPRFKKIPKHERKIKIDKRFQSMFNDERFQVKCNVDKRGRPILINSDENLKKYYDLSSEEEEEEEEEESGEEEDSNKNSVLDNDLKEVKLLSKDVKKKLKNLKVDYARGEGRLLTDSSSSDDDDDSSEEEPEEEHEHEWGELDKDAERTDSVTKRLAVCNIDWDRIKAEDLMVLFNSFVPAGGSILSVTIYPSDFGLKRMKEEEEKGPVELLKSNREHVVAESDDDDDAESRLRMEQLRKYQLTRLKYYYAVLVCDCESTANTIYTECDGLEYESSTNRFDLRFVPDDTVFDQAPRETCTTLPDMTKYKPRLFRTTALTQAKVELTWDETDPGRIEAVKSFHTAGKSVYDESKLLEYVACESDSSSEQEDIVGKNYKRHEEVLEADVPEVNGKKTTTSDVIDKYKALLSSIEEEENKKKASKFEMEVTWDVNLKNKTEKLVEEKLIAVEKKTPFEQYLQKRKEKRKMKKQQLKQKKEEKNSEDDEAFSDDDLPSDIDLNDDYFKSEMKKTRRKKNKKVSGEDEDDTEAKEKRAELELLMADDDDDDVINPKHFSLKKIEEQEKNKKKKKTKKGKKNVVDDVADEFKVDVEDERFSALYTSHHFNIDPADPQYKSTKGTTDLINEKLRRRTLQDKDVFEEPAKKSKISGELSCILKKIKRNTRK